MPPDTPVTAALDRTRVPAHVAWVAGGTAEWLERNGPGSADLVGASDAALLDLVVGALDLGVGWLTVCAPSAPDASDALAGWPARFGDRMAARGVEVRLLGARGVIPPVRPEAAEGASGPDRRPALVLTLAVGYSGRGEIVHAVERLAADGVDPAKVDEAAIAARLFAPDMPDPDVVVRSGGDRRISDLLLWEVAYSELVFVDPPWPDAGRADLVDAVVEFQRRDRRYGGLVASGGGR